MEFVNTHEICRSKRVFASTFLINPKDKNKQLPQHRINHQSPLNPKSKITQRSHRNIKCNSYFSTSLSKYKQGLQVWQASTKEVPAKQKNSFPHALFMDVIIGRHNLRWRSWKKHENWTFWSRWKYSVHVVFKRSIDSTYFMASSSCPSLSRPSVPLIIPHLIIQFQPFFRLIG